MSNSKKYHGYLALPRHAKLLRKTLGYRLYHYYLELVSNALWHRDNPRIGQIIGTQTDISKLLEVSQTTVSRIFDAFEAINRYFVVRRTRYFILGFFPFFLTDVAGKMAKKDYANLHDLYADMYKINAELQDNYAKAKERRVQNSPQSFNSSFNDNLGSYDDINNDDIDRGIEQRKEQGKP